MTVKITRMTQNQIGKVTIGIIKQWQQYILYSSSNYISEDSETEDEIEEEEQAEDIDEIENVVVFPLST